MYPRSTRIAPSSLPVSSCSLSAWSSSVRSIRFFESKSSPSGRQACSAASTVLLSAENGDSERVNSRAQARGADTWSAPRYGRSRAAERRPVERNPPVAGAHRQVRHFADRDERAVGSVQAQMRRHRRRERWAAPRLGDVERLLARVADAASVGDEGDSGGAVAAQFERPTRVSGHMENILLVVGDRSDVAVTGIGLAGIDVDLACHDGNRLSSRRGRGRGACSARDCEHESEKDQVSDAHGASFRSGCTDATAGRRRCRLPAGGTLHLPSGRSFRRSGSAFRPMTRRHRRCTVTGMRLVEKARMLVTEHPLGADTALALVLAAFVLQDVLGSQDYLTASKTIYVPAALL